MFHLLQMLQFAIRNPTHIQQQHIYNTRKTDRFNLRTKVVVRSNTTALVDTAMLAALQIGPAERRNCQGMVRWPAPTWARGDVGTWGRGRRTNTTGPVFSMTSYGFYMDWASGPHDWEVVVSVL